MRSYQSIVDFPFRFRKGTVSKKLFVVFILSSKGKEIVDICHLAKVRTYWVEEDELKVDVPLDQIYSWSILVTVKEI